jgi:outer membrane protein assembly factor BamB
MKSRGFIGFLFSAVVLVFVFNFVSTSLADDWPNFRGPEYNGVSEETNLSFDWPSDGPDILWKADIGTGFTSIAVSDGKVYVMGNTGIPPVEEEEEEEDEEEDEGDDDEEDEDEDEDEGDDEEDEDDEEEEGTDWAKLSPEGNFDVVYCFDASTGEKKWEHRYAAPLVPNGYEGGPNATPTVDSDRVYTLSKNGMLFCLNAETSKEIWGKNLIKEYVIKIAEWGLSGSVLIVDDMVIVNAAEKGMAFNKYDGRLIWKNGIGPTGYATPVPYTFKGKKCIALFGARHMYGLDPFTGEELWSVPWKTMYDENNPDPIISDDKIFICTGLGTGCALFDIHEDKVTQIWKNKKMQNFLNGSVLCEGYIYGPSDTRLTCMDFKTGDVVWTEKGFGWTSLIIADGKLIFLNDKGKLFIAEASGEGYKEISSAQIMSTKRSWTIPVLANGKIYARNSVGELVCVDVSSK